MLRQFKTRNFSNSRTVSVKYTDNLLYLVTGIRNCLLNVLVYFFSSLLYFIFFYTFPLRAPGGGLAVRRHITSEHSVGHSTSFLSFPFPSPPSSTNPVG